MIARDAFRFLFADREDIFYTKYLMKLDFEQYLYQQLKTEGYQSVYYFKVFNGENTSIYCESVDDAIKYQSQTGFFSSLGYKKITESGRERYWFDPHKNTSVCDTLVKLIQSVQQDKFVFVFPMELFAKLYREESTKSRLIDVLNRSRYNEGSIFVLVQEPEYDRDLPSLPEFIFTKDEMDSINRETGTRFLWERIRKLDKEHTVLWETFHEEQLQRLLRRVYLTQDEQRLEVIRDYMDKMPHMNLYKRLRDERDCVVPKKVRNKKDLTEHLMKDGEFRRLLHQIMHD